MKRVFVLGSINMDLVISVDRMPESGETLHGERFFSNGGGKGANQAVASAKQEIPTYLIGAVGSDVFADELLMTLNRYAVDTHFVKKLTSVSSGVAMILIDKTDHDNRIVLDGGANLMIAKEQIDEALAMADEGDLFVTQLENNEDAVHYALSVAKAHGMITIFNPAPAAVQPREIYDLVDILVVNETECKTLTGILPTDDETLQAAYQRTAEWGASSLVVTLGKRGSVCFNGNTKWNISSNPVQAVDTTAAGDTFVGVLAAGLAMGNDLKASLEYSSIAASLTCCRIGAQRSIPTRSEMCEYLDKRSISE